MKHDLPHRLLEQSMQAREVFRWLVEGERRKSPSVGADFAEVVETGLTYIVEGRH